MYFRKILITLCLFVAVGLQWISNAAAVPNLQLHVNGATYDVATETWVFQYTPGTPFTLRVIGANVPITNVFVSTAFLGVAEDTDISSVDIDFETTNYTESDFTWGQPPKLNPAHGVFPAYYVEEGVGDFGLVETVYDMMPGESGEAQGEIKEFSVTIYNSDFDFHFDTYDTIVLPRKLKAVFAPFSHDGGGTLAPEPISTALFIFGGLTLAAGRYRKTRQRKKGSRIVTNNLD
jgi:hypothetical protein